MHTTTDHAGKRDTLCTGALWHASGQFWFGTPRLGEQLSADSFSYAPVVDYKCAAGCLIDLDATPARMTVFVDGEPLRMQCEYDFPKDGRAWFPTVALCAANTALHSCAM